MGKNLPKGIVVWAPGTTLEETERFVILQCLTFNFGNKTKVSRQLGISLRTVRNKINQYRVQGFDIPGEPRGRR